MNMYLHEIKSMRKSTIIWICAMLAIAIIYFALYPGIVEDAADFKKLIGSYPAAVRAAMGISIDNITSILGFYSMIFSFITLCGAIQAMNIGVSIISKEARERTADFLLVKPVSRISIVTAKLMAAITMLLATNVIYYAGAYILASIVKTSHYSIKVFFMINLALFFIQLIFLAIGMVISVFFTKLKSVFPISLGTVFGFFIIGALIDNDKNDGIRFISPFRYFDLSYIIKNSSYEAAYLIVSAIIVIAAVAATYLIYTKKDIHAVS
ncbi:ABC transporter, permease protein [Clostridium pasteurianum DSM 525 = ATCC 6013]|uniref:ABC transporter, permease protein n=1 Tax=Clostridium pasteurianum DSM 525 = ATCC 6013 TaxID=1262449 RepID=A0A0H3JB32_CLOPA|nr:ABC transporter permease subunit [Clostridium pasteurianum]AJA49040.1 ABC transporter, permease protein [Clostridium pasteurianum DSM 525 = ATCC 6013]AJA53028.1 ABC transporter, permease protein [Clostridium pasteurianum DSM 525 = ATCC 6013]AOZ76245.1 ABC transporter permease [Clostridium pasteurianum DSM 525 = ATCC 6013]AOZ80041.1 ABC transporter permease [Clostridium pasteurianum]ELP60336.1 ABC transporter, permease protein, putative [Clostridium pasteurianum DSM 525 = ATCC 6013]